MRKTMLVLGIIFVILVGGAMAIRFFAGGDEDTWICENNQWVKHGNPSAAKPTGTCGGLPTAAKEEPLPIPTNATYSEATFRAAESAIKNSPTFKYDGMDLKFEKAQALKCQYCWEFIFTFKSSNGGYGDRSGQIVITVETFHQTSVTITSNDNKIGSVVTDQTFDELNQKFIK